MTTAIAGNNPIAQSVRQHGATRNPSTFDPAARRGEEQATAVAPSQRMRAQVHTLGTGFQQPQPPTTGLFWFADGFTSTPSTTVRSAPTSANGGVAAVSAPATGGDQISVEERVDRAAQGVVDAQRAYNESIASGSAPAIQQAEQDLIQAEAALTTAIEDEIAARQGRIPPQIPASDRPTAAATAVSIVARYEGTPAALAVARAALTAVEGSGGAGDPEAVQLLRDCAAAYEQYGDQSNPLASYYAAGLDRLGSDFVQSPNTEMSEADLAAYEQRAAEIEALVERAQRWAGINGDATFAADIVNELGGEGVHRVLNTLVASGEALYLDPDSSAAQAAIEDFAQLLGMASQSSALDQATIDEISQYTAPVPDFDDPTASAADRALNLTLLLAYGGEIDASLAVPLFDATWAAARADTSGAGDHPLVIEWFNSQQPPFATVQETTIREQMILDAVQRDPEAAYTILTRERVPYGYENQTDFARDLATLDLSARELPAGENGETILVNTTLIDLYEAALIEYPADNPSHNPITTRNVWNRVIDVVGDGDVPHESKRAYAALSVDMVYTTVTGNGTDAGPRLATDADYRTEVQDFYHELGYDDAAAAIATGGAVRYLQSELLRGVEDAVEQAQADGDTGQLNQSFAGELQNVSLLYGVMGAGFEEADFDKTERHTALMGWLNWAADGAAGLGIALSPLTGGTSAAVGLGARGAIRLGVGFLNGATAPDADSAEQFYNATSAVTEEAFLRTIYEDPVLRAAYVNDANGARGTDPDTISFEDFCQLDSVDDASAVVVGSVDEGLVTTIMWNRFVEQ